MITPNFFTSSANTYAPLNSVGQKPIGQEDSSSRFNTTKPVEQLANSGKQQLRTRDKNLESDSGQQAVGSNAYLRRNAVSQTDLAGVSSRNIASEDDKSSEEGQRNDGQEQSLQEKARQREQQLEIRDLASRDREVRAHERAHSAIGGQYAGAPSYEYTRGPDGVNYAISGEVPIDVGKEATPQETIQKAQVVRRAALAPAEPSPADRSVAAQASRMEAEAQRELAVQRQSEAEQQREARKADAEEDGDAPSGIQQDEKPAVNPSSVSSPNSSTNIPSQISSRSFASSADSSLPTVLSYNASRLQQTIASTSPNPNRAGSILDQIA